MATCADCVHVEVCKFKDLPAPLSDSYIKESECIEKRCGNFKDRSRLVELPCNINDVIYRIKAKQVIKSRVNRFEINWLGVKLLAVRRIGLGWSDEFGTKWFLTKKQAEQALKERESK